MDDSYNLEYNEESKEYRINLFHDASTLGWEPIGKCSKIEFYVLEAFIFTKKRKSISKQTLIRTLREVRTLLRHLQDYQLHLIRTA